VFLSSSASDFVTGTAIPVEWRLFDHGPRLDSERRFSLTPSLSKKPRQMPGL
jgi:hypothetical protein